MLLLPMTRGKWATQTHFIVSLLGATIGFGDVLRYPAFVLKEKDGAFLVPYLLFAVIIGIPLVAMEIFLGQFSSTGPATCWYFCPVFRGVGFGSMILGTFFIFFYQVYITWSFIYIFKSFSVVMPWKNCNKDWASDLCLDYLSISSATHCTDMGWNVSDDGACYNASVSPPKIQGLWNSSHAAENDIRAVLPTEEYLTKHILGCGKDGISLNNLGEIHWDLVGCLFVVWVIIVLALFWGLTSLVKVLYLAIIYTFCALTIRLVYDITREGGLDGIRYFLTINLYSLSNTKLWLDAANQVFFTLSVNTGVLMCMSSFSSYKGDCCLSSSALVFSNIMVSILSSCITFAILGSVSKKLQLPIHELDYGGNNLGFIIYPHSIADKPLSALWSVLFFIMIFFVGISSAMAYVQTVITCLLDLFPRLRLHKTIVLTAISIIYFLLELPLVTDGGFYILQLTEKGTFSFNIFVLSFLQCAAVAWIYGALNFVEDISVMVGDTACSCLSWRVLKYGFAFSWAVLCPIFTFYNVCATFVEAFPNFTTLEGAVALAMSCTTLLPIPVIALQTVLKKKGSFLQRIYMSCKPTDRWGPVLHKNRKPWLIHRKGTHVDSLVMHSRSSTSATTQFIAALKDEMTCGRTMPGDPLISSMQIIASNIQSSQGVSSNHSIGTSEAAEKPVEGNGTYHCKVDEVEIQLPQSPAENVPATCK